MTRIIIFVFLLILFSCQSAKPDQEQPVMEEALADTPAEIPNDFRAFYDRFHSDTAFQAEHIIFPLSGIPANADTLAAGTIFKWQRDGWRWHRPIDPTLTGFEREWQVITKEMIIETIKQKSAGFGMIRRFAKMDNDWKLIYYAAMNPM